MVVTIGVLVRPRKRMRREIGMIVNEVEPIGLLKQMREMTKFPDFRVDLRVLGIGLGHDAIELAGSHAVERGE